MIAKPAGVASGSTVMERQSRMVAVVGVLFLVALAIAAVMATRRVVRSQVEASLQALLATTSSGVKGWYADQSRTAQQLSRSDVLRDKALTLLSKGRGDNGAVISDIDHTLAEQYIGILVIDQALTQQASSQADWKIEKLPEDILARLHQCLAGEAIVTRPVLVGSGPSRRTVVFLGLPVRARNGTEVAGALLLAQDPMTELRPILAGTWSTGYGETYMASRDGIMLICSRPLAELRQFGLVSSEVQQRALDLQLVDPGRELTPENPWRSTDGSGPTIAARAVAGGQTGGDLEGSRDYRGIVTIAQWNWLPEIGVGLVCKLDRQYAYWPIRILELICLCALIVAAAGLSVGLVYFRRSSWAIRRAWEVQRRVDEIDRYVIGAKIGEGAMGSVYRATHARLRRQAAIKVIRAQAMTPENIVRFEHEAQMTCRLSHPNTVQIFDYGTHADGSLFYVMEYLEGLSLHDLVARDGPQPAGRVIHILVQALGALAEAHRLGLIHRDIKPSNIYLATLGGRCDVVKLLDFGLAHDHESAANDLTSTGALLGSPSCMPPELIAKTGKPLDGRSDLYSLACVGYKLLCGQDVFLADSVMGILHAHLHEAPVSPSQRLCSGMPPDLEAVIMRNLSKLPEERHADADEFRHALSACADAGRWNEEDARSWWQRTHGVYRSYERAKQAESMAATRLSKAVQIPAVPAIPLVAAGSRDE